MKPAVRILLPGIILLLIVALVAFSQKHTSNDDRMVSYIVDPKMQEVQLYWKDDQGKILRSFEHLKTYVEGKKQVLKFAMNGGMFTQEFAPLGLFIQNKKVLAPLNRADASGNFYLKPNGVFYVTTDNTPFVCNTTAFKNDGSIKYATQSGPMLVIDGQIHPAFKEGSANLNIRNGVGILPGNKIVFAMSKGGINFYDFAKYFRDLGCKNALYLDGFVSRMYLPEKGWEQTDGEFGVMIGVVANK
ncbi:MAG: phosphodiester glycosidase family protein [Chitinophagaceae bacterium]